MDTTYLPINSQPYTNCFVTKVRFIHPNYNPFPLVNNMLFFLNMNMTVTLSVEKMSHLNNIWSKRYVDFNYRIQIL